MANSKSALKRWRQSLVRRDRNRSIKSRTRTSLGKALAAIQDDASTAEEAVRTAVSALDKAAQAGVIHENAAARGKSRLLKRYNLAIANKVMSDAASTPAPAKRTKAASSSNSTRTRRTEQVTPQPCEPASSTRPVKSPWWISPCPEAGPGRDCSARRRRRSLSLRRPSLQGREVRQARRHPRPRDGRRHRAGRRGRHRLDWRAIAYRSARSSPAVPATSVASASATAA